MAFITEYLFLAPSYKNSSNNEVTLDNILDSLTSDWRTKQAGFILSLKFHS